MLMPEMIPKPTSQISGTVTEMLHSWWLAECHLDRLMTKHSAKIKDIENHREAALQYLKYFETAVLPSKEANAPKGTRAQRIEELEGYRLDSLQHYKRLKALVYQGEHRLEHIRTHLACTLAAIEGHQVNLPDAEAPDLQGLDADLHKALCVLLREHHEGLLHWKFREQSQNAKSSSGAQSDAPLESSVIRSGQSVHHDGTSSQAHDVDAVDLRQQLQHEQEHSQSLERRMKDADAAVALHLQEMARMQANMQAIKSAGRRSEEARRMHQQHEEELSREKVRILQELGVVRQATADAEQIILQQAVDVQTVHKTNKTLAEVNDNLQGQVTHLQQDNFSFQSRVTALQETTGSLSSQISALAQQAQSAASTSTQLQVLRSVAASLQQERDAAKNQILTTQQENQTLSGRVSDLSQQLSSAASQIKGLKAELQAGSSSKQDAAGKGKLKSSSGSSSQPQQQQVVDDGGSSQHGQADLMTVDQAVMDEATIKQLQENLQAAAAKNHKLEQEKTQLHKDLKAAKGIRQEVERMQADLIKSSRNLDAVPPHPPQAALPAPQVSPASPPKHS